MEEKKDRIIDEAMEEIIRNQTESATFQFASLMKNSYENFLRVGFSKEMAEKMVIAMVEKAIQRVNNG